MRGAQWWVVCIACFLACLEQRRSAAESPADGLEPARVDRRGPVLVRAGKQQAARPAAAKRVHSVRAFIFSPKGVAPGRELYTLAVAGDDELSSLNSLTMLGDAVDVRAWQRAARDLELMRSSVSWRVTAPLRLIRRLAR